MFLEVSQNSQENPVPESPFNKAVGLRPAILLKKRLWHTCFPVNFVKNLRIRFLQNTSGPLLLHKKQAKKQNEKSMLETVCQDLAYNQRKSDHCNPNMSPRST